MDAELTVQFGPGGFYSRSETDITGVYETPIPSANLGEDISRIWPISLCSKPADSQSAKPDANSGWVIIARLD